jgi:hypothetical protein
MLKSSWAFTIAIALSSLIVAIGIWQHPGPQVSSDYHYYFGYGLIAAPLIIFLLSKGRIWQDIGFSAIAIALIILAAQLFWHYQDRPWFDPPRQNCDGPCYGWFSFENELLVKELLVVGGGAILVGLVLKIVKRRLTQWLQRRAQSR